jgi:UDP-N-acetylmuramate: L-alanyl-gamma-D-glutamyl-meso-diaminopimelate ligase
MNAAGKPATAPPTSPSAASPEAIDGHVLLGQLGSEVAAALSAALERVTTIATTGKISRTGLRELRENIERARRIGIMGQQVNRLATGRVRQSAERVDLTAVLRDSLQQHRRHFEAQGIELRQVLGPAQVMADATLIFTLVETLLTWVLEHARSPVDLRIDLNEWPVFARVGCQFRYLSNDQVDRSLVTFGETPLQTMSWRLLQQTARTMELPIRLDDDGAAARLTVEFPRTVNDPSRPMHIHILGICGTFMGGLAAMAREAGHRVTGCDAHVYPPMSDQLRALGIDLIEGFGRPAGAGARRLRHRQRGQARQPADGGHPRRRRALHQRPAVAGRARAAGPARAGGGRHARQDHDHVDAGLDPRAGRLAARLPGRRRAAELRRLGAAGPRPPSSSRPTSTTPRFFDKRSKFVHYRPRTAVLNNLEFDHADIFPDLAAIETQFHHLVRTVPASGRLVVNARRALQRVLQRGCWSEVQRFGAKREEPGGCARAASRMPSTCCAAACASGASTGTAAGRAQPAQRAGRDRRGRARGRGARGRGAALGGFQNVRRRLELRGEAAASRSTTTSRTTRRRCAPRSTACAARSARPRILACSSRAPTP